MLRLMTFFALCIGILFLANCGLRGELERPQPVFGSPPIEGASDPRCDVEEGEKMPEGCQS